MKFPAILRVVSIANKNHLHAGINLDGRLVFFGLYNPEVVTPAMKKILDGWNMCPVTVELTTPADQFCYVRPS